MDNNLAGECVKAKLFEATENMFTLGPPSKDINGGFYWLQKVNQLLKENQTTKIQILCLVRGNTHKMTLIFKVCIFFQ